MSEILAVTDRARWARFLNVVGAVTTLASAVVGHLWLQRMPEAA